jgi:hypothetical protein
MGIRRITSNQQLRVNKYNKETLGNVIELLTYLGR